MHSLSSFPFMFSLRDNFSLEATAFIRAAVKLIGTDFTVRDSWEKFYAANFVDHGERRGHQMLRVHYRLCYRGPRVVKFYFFKKLQDGEDAVWACVGETGPRSHIHPPQESDNDIRWY